MEVNLWSPRGYNNKTVGVCVHARMCMNELQVFSSYFAWAYREIGRRRSVGGVMERGVGGGLKKRQVEKCGPRRIKEELRQQGKQVKESPECTKNLFTNNRSDVTFFPFACLSCTFQQVLSSLCFPPSVFALSHPSPCFQCFPFFLMLLSPKHCA